MNFGSDLSNRAKRWVSAHATEGHSIADITRKIDCKSDAALEKEPIRVMPGSQEEWTPACLYMARTVQRRLTSLLPLHGPLDISTKMN